MKTVIILNAFVFTLLHDMLRLFLVEQMMRRINSNFSPLPKVCKMHHSIRPLISFPVLLPQPWKDKERLFLLAAIENF
jgi:hypothetical protein